ncbi:putative secreted protein [Rhodopirellula sallentina SM41]|uniref:Putative secreted protein n=1 Tax=Rhodopirellula sallentina SM41 TaxID=1263870 RepID=M5TRQ4_9BACT|nr:putative secreted protein [Rhodopirellula sallentina SM41]
MRTGLLLRLFLITLVCATSGRVSAQQEATHARALPYQGTWGVRILCPTAYDKSKTPDADVSAENFDIDFFISQVDQLTSINHVMINIGRGHQASWYSSPYPEMEAIMGEDLFPERDFFGEMLDALKSRDLKVLVYFSVTGMDRGYLSAKQMKTWKAHLASAGLTHNEGVAQIMGYYSRKFGPKIDGWWIDRAGSRFTNADRELFATAVRTGNPNAMVAMHRKVGYPIVQGSPYCDYTAGHPVPMKQQPPWSMANVRMVENIEAGPWINQNGVPDTSDGTALGAIFMPFQRQWRDGAADFPTEQAVAWTTRVMDAGGMYTWAVSRKGHGFAAPQFKQLLEINAAIERRNQTRVRKSIGASDLP